MRLESSGHAHITHKENTPAESNYEIYDKDLAIVKCLRTWASELRSVPHFEVITDHQNLTYFTTTRKLKERQMRWAEELSRFNFTIRYRPGREGTMADVLSRRDQDMPFGAHDRYAHREAVLLRPEIMKDFTAGSLRLNRPALALVATPVHVSPPSDADAHFSVDSTAPDAPNRPDTHPSPRGTSQSHPSFNFYHDRTPVAGGQTSRYAFG